MNPIRLAYTRFTSCCGCQLTLLNCEQELAQLTDLVEPVSFVMASSRPDDGDPLDVVIVEGAVSRPEELDELLTLRRRAQTLVAIGACALTGGVNTLAGRNQVTLCRGVYREACADKKIFPPQALKRFVAVDLEIAGCPPERREILETLTALRRGGLPASLPEYPVCMECRQRENLCLLLEDKQPCLGPVTLAGCRALCPSAGVACEGCRGLAPEAAQDEMIGLLLELGLSEENVRARMERFTGGRNEVD